jgi:hypothetical protein
MDARVITLTLLGPTTTGGAGPGETGLRLIAKVTSDAWSRSAPPKPDAAGQVRILVEAEQFAAVYSRTIAVLSETNPEWPMWVKVTPI